MQVKYRTKFWEILPEEIAREIKRLQQANLNSISGGEEEELRERIFDDSLDLRLKEESISAIARSQLGMDRNEKINEGNLDSRTIESLRKKSIKVYHLGSLISSSSKYWFSNPQTYNHSISNQRMHKQLPRYNMRYVLKHLFIPGILPELLYTPLIRRVPDSIEERITSDIEWMIGNQCTMGVSRYDLFHTHICFELNEGGHFKSQAIEIANESVRDMQRLYPLLLTTVSFIKPYFREYREKVHLLYNTLFENVDTMLLLYHSFEHANPNHPLYINRTVLTGNSNRFCVMPVLDNLGISAEEINGISELSVRFYFRVNPRRSKTDCDLEHLEVYATPFVFRSFRS